MLCGGTWPRRRCSSALRVARLIEHRAREVAILLAGRSRLLPPGAGLRSTRARLSFPPRRGSSARVRSAGSPRGRAGRSSLPVACLRSAGRRSPGRSAAGFCGALFDSCRIVQPRAVVLRAQLAVRRGGWQRGRYIAQLLRLRVVRLASLNDTSIVRLIQRAASNVATGTMAAGVAFWR